MINSILDSFYNLALKAIESLPDVSDLNIPDGVYDGIGTIFQFVGWIMPYNFYEPLIVFILSLTSFRIVYAIYLHFKK